MSTPLFEPFSDGKPNRRVSPWLHAAGSIALGALAMTSACAQPALPCSSELQAGDVVFSEIRGPQTGADSRGEWLEVFNTTAEAIDLLGVRIEFRNIRGTQQIDILVRESLVVEPGGYAVLGSLADPPPEVDYSFNLDFVVNVDIEDSDGTLVIPTNEGLDPRSLFANASIELRSCEETIDEIAYAALPSLGTYSLDGALTPSAENNEGTEGWCNDQAEAPPDGPQVDVGLYGSPGAANPPCPASP